MNTLHQKPNLTLLGLEAKATNDFAEVLLERKDAGRYTVPSFQTMAYYDAAALVVTVTYHPDLGYTYLFEAGPIHGRYDNRESCLQSLAAHMPEVQ